MVETNYTEKDYRLFREKLPQWQERYTDLLCHRYIALLSDETNPPQDRFHELERQIRRDKTHKGVTCEIRRSTFVRTLACLIEENVIGMEDLSGFSPRLRDTLLSICCGSLFPEAPSDPGHARDTAS